MSSIKSVIFCQSPADLKFALEIYERRKSAGAVLFVTFEVEGMRRFLEFLHLPQVAVCHISHPRSPPSLRCWGNNWALRRWLYGILAEHFQAIQGAEVFYFSNEIEWVAPACIAYLSRQNKVMWCPHHQYTCVAQTVSWHHSLLQHVYRWTTGADFEWRRIEGSPTHKQIFWFCYEHYGVVRQPVMGMASDILKAYSYDWKSPLGQRSAVVFENPEEDISDDYETIMRQVVQLLKAAGFTVLIKPHPRVGYSSFLDQLDVKFIPAFIPGEFLPVDRFDLILGLCSTALGYMACARPARVLSLAKLFQPRDQQVMDYGINYVAKVAEGKLHFVESWEALHMLIKRNAEQAA